VTTTENTIVILSNATVENKTYDRNDVTYYISPLQRGQDEQEYNNLLDF
jgi:hypothetical protein